MSRVPAPTELAGLLNARTPRRRVEFVFELLKALAAQDGLDDPDGPIAVMLDAQGASLWPPEDVAPPTRVDEAEERGRPAAEVLEHAGPGELLYKGRRWVLSGYRTRTPHPVEDLEAARAHFGKHVVMADRPVLIHEPDNGHWTIEPFLEVDAPTSSDEGGPT